MCRCKDMPRCKDPDCTRRSDCDTDDWCYEHDPNPVFDLPSKPLAIRGRIVTRSEQRP